MKYTDLGKRNKLKIPFVVSLLCCILTFTTTGCGTPKPDMVEEVYADSTILDGTEGANVFPNDMSEINCELNGYNLYTNDFVNFRKSPEISDSNIIDVLNMTEQVFIPSDEQEDVAEGWMKCIHAGIPGYIKTEYLSPYGPSLYRYIPSVEEWRSYTKVVEAEMTGDTGMWHNVSDEDFYLTKLRIAQNILNRIECTYFPNDMESVIFERNAYSPTVDGRFWDVEVTDMTIRACKEALLKVTPDKTQNTVYFRSDGGTFVYGDLIFDDGLMTYWGNYYCECHKGNKNPLND